MLDIDVFSPAENQHQVNIYYYYTEKQCKNKKGNFILCR